MFRVIVPSAAGHLALPRYAQLAEQRPPSSASRGLTTPDENALAGLRAHIVQALRTSERTTVKALLKTLVAEVIVTDRYAIQPIFRVPVGNSRHPKAGRRFAAWKIR
jgi:hypothetical protein